MNFDKGGKIRLGTDLRFVNSARPWDTVSPPQTIKRWMQSTNIFAEVVKPL